MFPAQRRATPLVNGAAFEGGHRRASRTRLWELASTLHCSIIGTCLPSAELSRLLVKLNLASSAVDDHAAHKIGVTIAGRHDVSGKMVNKALDDRHKLTINRFAKCTTSGEVAAHWKLALESGDIPGAYWATLTHPLATHMLIAEAFGDVHLLSHLVGAANRADIRRLCKLEAENAALAEKLECQQLQLQRACRPAGKQYVPLRTASASSLLACLAGLAAGRYPAATSIAAE